jgi:hypothetical protein
MLNRLTLIASSVAALIVAATLIAQPGQAQTAAQAAKKDAASECLSRPGGVAPRGSHWFYRLERPSGRRCWYLGAEGTKVRRATAAERKAALAPAPLMEDEAPPLPRARERADSRSVATTDANAIDANTANTADANTAETNSVTAAQFSSAWPLASNAGGPSNREPTAGAGSNDAAETASAGAQDEMPSVRPALAPAGAAAAGQPAEPAPGLGHLLLFLAASVAFIAIIVRSLLKLLSASRMRSEPRPAVQRAAPVIRTRSLERLASDQMAATATREGRPLRPLDIATRWDSVSRLPRTPGVPLFDDSTGNADAPIYADEGAALRRRRRVA